MRQPCAWLTIALTLLLTTYCAANDESEESRALILPASLIADYEPVENFEPDSYAAVPAAFAAGSAHCTPATHGTACRSTCYCSSGFFGGTELTLLTPHTGSVSFPGFGGVVIPKRDLGVGGRYWLGYRAASGLGVRTRYWNYSQDTALTGALAGDSLTLDAKVWDAEITQMLNRGRFSFDVSGGVRWGQINDQVGPLLTESFDGWGSTVAGLARRRLGDGPFSLVGGARGSLLFGDHNVGIIGVPIDSTQEVLPMLEMQLGTEFGKVLSCGKVAFARAALETQMWELPPTAIGLFDQNIGLVGVALGGGIRF